MTTIMFLHPQDHMPGGRFYTSDGVGGAIQETYVSGSTIEAEFFITAHHRGFIELRICDEAHVTQECLLKYEPLERVRFEDDYTYSAQPIDPQYPGRFFLNPVCAFDQESDRTYSGYRMTGQFKLPEGSDMRSLRDPDVVDHRQLLRPPRLRRLPVPKRMGWVLWRWRLWFLQ